MQTAALRHHMGMRGFDKGEVGRIAGRGCRPLVNKVVKTVTDNRQPVALAA